MIHNLSGKKKGLFYVCLTVALTAVCTTVLFVLVSTDVFGKFVAKTPYVTGTPEVRKINVTPEGSNQKDKDGSGAPTLAGVPSCEGKKGTKTNPFVVLEIVPDKAQQQLIYLGLEEGAESPLDLMKIGIQLAKDNNKSYAESSATMSQNDLKALGQWFCNYSYNVYKIGSNEEKESMPFAYIDKLYTLKFTDEDIDALYKEENAGVPEDQTASQRFAEVFKQTNQQYARDWHDIEELSNQFPRLFARDSDGKSIRDIALKDRYNWKASREKVVLAEEESEKYQGSGYLIMVEPGKGDFGFASKEDFQNWTLSKTGTDADRWVYVETLEEVEAKYPEALEYYNSNKGQLTPSGYKYIREDGTQCYWEGDMNKLYENQESAEFNNLMMKLEQSPWITVTYLKSREAAEYVYKFQYYGVTNHNILKRSLFTFKDEKDFEDFHMQVICMTPAELNKACVGKDTDATVDMIERADMYYIQSGDFDGNSVNDTDMLENLYYTYVAPNEKKGSEDITFYENDLEWELCQKIIQRQSAVKTLPLMFNQMVAKMAELGISRKAGEVDVHNYVTDKTQNKRTCIPEKGSRNNLAKLYLISIQFDLLARRETTGTVEGTENAGTSGETGGSGNAGDDSDEDDEDDSGDVSDSGEEYGGYVRTFMNDIYPDIKTVSIPYETEGGVDGTAKTTAYYNGSSSNPMKLCSCALSDTVTQEFKERVYYLWNAYTFLPQDMEHDPLSMNLGSDEVLEEMISQGYLPSIGDSNNNNQPFQSDIISHHSGSDGYDEKNVGVITDPSNSNTNHSSFLGNNGDSGGIANHALDVIFQIMNNQTVVPATVTVTAEEQRRMYVKIADDTVMYDYEEEEEDASKAKSVEKDKDLYLKVRFWNNGNNRSGRVKSIRLVNDKGDQKTMKLYKTRAFAEECDNWKVDGNACENQYVVSADDAYLEGYIKFKLSDWKKGYTTMRFRTVGYIYHTKKKKEIAGPTVKLEISLIGKTLFELE